MSGEETQETVCVSACDSKQTSLPKCSLWPGGKSGSSVTDGDYAQMQVSLLEVKLGIPGSDSDTFT